MSREDALILGHLELGVDRLSRNIRCQDFQMDIETVSKEDLVKVIEAAEQNSARAMLHILCALEELERKSLPIEEEAGTK